MSRFRNTTTVIAIGMQGILLQHIEIYLVVVHAWIACHIKKLGKVAKLTFTVVQNLLGTVAGHQDAWRINGGPS